MATTETHPTETVDPQKLAHWECNCVPHQGTSHCHRCSDIAGHPVAWADSIHADGAVTL